MIYPPKGDAFAERNKYALEIDFEKEPPMFRITDTHFAATWLLHPYAPKVEMPKAITDRINRMRQSREPAAEKSAEKANNTENKDKESAKCKKKTKKKLS